MNAEEQHPVACHQHESPAAVSLGSAEWPRNQTVSHSDDYNVASHFALDDVAVLELGCLVWPEAKLQSLFVVHS